MQTDVIAQSVISLTYSIIETGCEDQSKRLVNLLPQVIQAVKIASGDMSEDIVDILGVIADFTETHDILRKEGVVQFLVSFILLPIWRACGDQRSLAHRQAAMEPLNLFRCRVSSNLF